MKAMILAAGRGERMRPLTDSKPKPLLLAGGQPIIVHTLKQLRLAGFEEIVINLAHLGEQISRYLGDGRQWGVTIRYSNEGDHGLETAGGIAHALPLLGEKPFLVINGDIATDFPLASLKNRIIDQAHLVLVDNPEHHPQGDFGLDAPQSVVDDSAIKFTFSGIGVYHPSLFNTVTPGTSQKLAPLLRQALAARRVSGEKYSGFWLDIGTPQRLQELDHHYLKRNTP
ncbi:MAG: mannose-1-phosphate guanylyltransferase [Gammaproteobacteria bacterium HGW-Gammaproteobacteria-3]|nr:MAG: mannose-1-phosphate guanylyltransferase [Gammaproteobacteria bacterium HGW-Gammaproteobacteria-3]